MGNEPTQNPVDEEHVLLHAALQEGVDAVGREIVQLCCHISPASIAVPLLSRFQSRRNRSPVQMIPAPAIPCSDLRRLNGAGTSDGLFPT